MSGTITNIASGYVSGWIGSSGGIADIEDIVNVWIQNHDDFITADDLDADTCLLYTSPSPRD